MRPRLLNISNTAPAAREPPESSPGSDPLRSTCQTPQKKTLGTDLEASCCVLSQLRVSLS
eukprot:5645905-Alexandrium_andersonii.AAC.1